MVKGKLCALPAVVLALAAASWAEFRVNNHTYHHQIYPAVAMNRTGDFAVVWRSHVADGRGGGVYARCFSVEGTPLSDEFKVDSTPVGVDGWKPAIAISAAGRVMIAWVAVQDGSHVVVARMFNAQGQPLTDEFLVGATPTEAAQSAPAIAMNPAGAFAIVWTNSYGVGPQRRTYIAGRVFSSKAAPVSDEFPVAELAQAERPDVAMDDSGRFVVTWIRMGDTYNRPYGEYIMFRRFAADGTPLAGPVPVTGDLNSRWYGPSVAAGRTGQFAITWAIGPFPCDICMQTFDAQARQLTKPYIINTCLDSNQGHPCVVTDGLDGYLVVWDSQGQDGDCHGVFGQCCSGDGVLDGGEMALNSYTAGRQWYPDAAMSPTGDYVVVWISENQDGSGYGVFAETGSK